MLHYNSEEEESNVSYWVGQYEGMVKRGDIRFLDSEVFQQLIDYYEEHSLIKKALNVIDNAIAQHGYSATFYIRKAQILLEDGRFSDTQRALDAAKIYEPSNIDIFFTQADLYRHLKEYGLALETLNQAAMFVDDEDLIDHYILRASIYEAQELYTKAFHSLMHALNKDPFNELVFSRLWMCMELAENFETAIKKLNALIDEAPYSYWAWYNLGYAYAALELHEKAAEAFDYAIVINDHFEFAYRDRVESLLLCEQYDEALRCMEDYLEIFEADADILLKTGECYEFLENYNKALQLYQKALAKDALEGLAYYRMGVCYAKQQQWQKALKLFGQAYDLNPGDAQFSIALAEIHNQLDNVDKVYLFYEKAMELAPDDEDMWVDYLAFLADEEEYDKAIDRIELARSLFDSATTDYMEAAIYWAMGNKQEAFVLLIGALEADADKHELLFDIIPEMEQHPEIALLIQRYNQK